METEQRSIEVQETPAERWWAARHARFLLGVGSSLVLLVSILAANWVTTGYGFISVGFGLAATAGTIFAGFALAARDAVQDTLGKRVVVALILAGTVVSYSISEAAIATASAVAFLLGELLDFSVYTPLRKNAKFGGRRWAVAVVFSNIVGAVMDTVVFLGVAFGAAAIAPAVPGQMLGKLYATVAFLFIGRLLAVWMRRRRTFRTPVAS